MKNKISKFGYTYTIQIHESELASDLRMCASEHLASAPTESSVPKVQHVLPATINTGARRLLQLTGCPKIDNCPNAVPRWPSYPN